MMLKKQVMTFFSGEDARHCNFVSQRYIKEERELITRKINEQIPIFLQKIVFIFHKRSGLR